MVYAYISLIVFYSSKQKLNWIRMLYYIGVLLYSCSKKFVGNIKYQEWMCFTHNVILLTIFFEQLFFLCRMFDYK